LIEQVPIVMSPDLNVLLRHRPLSIARSFSRDARLLRQSGGFEGFPLRLIERDRGLLAVSNRDQPRASSLNRDAVSTSKVYDVLRDQDAVLDLYWAIDDLDPNFVPVRKEPLRGRPDTSCPR
jgi:hypothetical protein